MRHECIKTQHISNVVNVVTGSWSMDCRKMNQWWKNYTAFLMKKQQQNQSAKIQTFCRYHGQVCCLLPLCCSWLKRLGDGCSRSLLKLDEPGRWFWSGWSGFHLILKPVPAGWCRVFPGVCLVFQAAFADQTDFCRRLQRWQMCGWYTHSRGGHHFGCRQSLLKVSVMCCLCTNTAEDVLLRWLSKSSP